MKAREGSEGRNHKKEEREERSKIGGRDPKLRRGLYLHISVGSTSS